MTPLEVFERQSIAQDPFGRRPFYDETLRHFATAPDGRIPFENISAAYDFDRAWGEALYRVRLAMMGVVRDR